MPIREYREFELEAGGFVRDEGGVERFSVKVSISPAGESTGKTEREIPPDLRKVLRLLERRKLDADGVISLGEKLADLLLPDEVRWLFKGSKSMLGDNQGLRLRLRLDPALAGIPWEYMFVPRAGGGKNPADFLVLDPLISIARHEAVSAPGDFPDTPKRRRLLVASASPQREEPLDLARERDNLEKALRDVPEVELDFVENATVQALRDKLETDADIFHFAGHGTFSGKRMSEAFGTMEGEGAILLVGEDGRAATTKAAVLEVILRGHGVQLVVLGACQTGQPGAGSVWSSVAAALMKAGIPAAVAMQYGIWDDAAIAFNRSFYRALAAGLPLDYAVSAGRQAAFCLCYPLCDDEKRGGYWRDFAVPVLYLRARKEFVLPAIPDVAKREDVTRSVHAEAERRERELAEKGIPAPALTGKSFSEAEDLASKAGVVVREKRRRYHSSAPVNAVIEQSPEAGTPVNAGAVIEVVLSKGPESERVVVPDVTERPEREIKRNKRKNPLKAFFLTVSGVFGVIPGLAVILSGLGTPPEKAGLFGGVVGAFGVLTLIILWVNRGKIAKLSRSKVTKVSIALGILCFVFVGGYFYLFDLCVVKHELYGSAYFPLWTSGEITDMVENSNGRRAAIERYGIDAVREAIREMPTYALSLTSAVLLLVYQGVFTSLAAAFGFLGVHRKKELNSWRPIT